MITYRRISTSRWRTRTRCSSSLIIEHKFLTKPSWSTGVHDHFSPRWSFLSSLFLLPRKVQSSRGGVRILRRPRMREAREIIWPLPLKILLPGPIFGALGDRLPRHQCYTVHKFHSHRGTSRSHQLSDVGTILHSLTCIMISYVILERNCSFHVWRNTCIIYLLNQSHS